MKRAIHNLKLIIAFLLPPLGRVGIGFLFLLISLVWVGGGLLCSCENRHTGDRMRFMLDSLQKENQAYTLFTSDSLQLELCRYFDRWGNNNERMKAYYLLGRAYHDMGEVPHALEIYQQAAEMADTTSNDCDYTTLNRIHSQIAALYSLLKMHNEELSELCLAEQYAWKGNDTLTALIYSEMKSTPYYLANEYDSVIINCNLSHDLYFKYGYKDIACRPFGIAAFTLLEQDSAAKAKQYMDKYETYIGTIDGSHDVPEGMEIYYATKGRYYFAVNNFDSCEYFFRKLLHFVSDPNNAEAAFQGLLKLYQHKHNPDSVAKYANLYGSANDASYQIHSTEELKRTQSLYNYERHQRIAESLLHKNRNMRMFLLLVLTVSVFICTLLIIIIRFKNKQAKRDRELYITKYQKALYDYVNAREELELLRSASYTHKLEDGLKKSEEAEKELSVFDEEFTLSSIKNDLEVFNDYRIKELHKYAVMGTAPDQLFMGCVEMFEKLFPNFMSSLNSCPNRLSEQEIKTCILIKLHFANSEIQNLLNTSPQRVTNICSSINKKLFNAHGAKSVRKNVYKMTD